MDCMSGIAGFAVEKRGDIEGFRIDKEIFECLEKLDHVLENEGL